MNLRRETLAALEAMKHALEIARRGIGTAAVAAKAGRDLVTAVDVAVEDAVRDRLTGALGIAVVGEERGGAAGSDGAPYWLLDPICGTRNYASRIPLYCVNLALVEGGEVTVAVIGNPPSGEIDVAERGRGAWRLADDARRTLRTDTRSLTLVIEAGKSTGRRREQAARFTAAAMAADRWDIRSLGTTLALPYVAAGQIAAYAVFSVSAIHAAAGSVLVSEAGGTTSDIEGRPWTVRSDSVLASADRDLHDELLGVISRTG